MKIDATRLLNPNALHLNFKHSEDEYIFVPLVWDDTCDTFERAPEQPKTNPLDKLPENSGFKKFVTKAKKAGGLIVIAPPAVAGFADTISTSAKSITNSVKETTQTVLNTKEELKDMLGKHHKQEPVEQHPTETEHLAQNLPHEEPHGHELQGHEELHHEDEHQNDEDQYGNHEDYPAEIPPLEYGI